LESWLDDIANFCSDDEIELPGEAKHPFSVVVFRNSHVDTQSQLFNGAANRCE